MDLTSLFTRRPWPGVPMAPADPLLSSLPLDPGVLATDEGAF